MIEIKVPTVGESISEVTLLKWLKKDGEFVDRDDVIAELESEKATFEVNAEQSGVIKLIATEGDTLNIGAVLANIDEKAKVPEAVTSANNLKRPKVIEQPEAESKPEPTKSVDQPSAENVEAKPAAA